MAADKTENRKGVAIMEYSDYTGILASNISELRRRAGLTQDALAEKLGVTFQAVSKWERGGSLR